MQPSRQCASMVGRWRFSPPPFAAFWALFSAALIGAVLLAFPAIAGGVKYADDLSLGLNPTGRTVAFAVPVKDGTAALGEVMIEITADDKIRIEKKAFLERLAAVAGQAALDAIAALPDDSGYLAIEQFGSTGVDVRFDAGLQELQIALSADQRPTGDLSLGGRQAQRASADLVQPESIAGYLNVIAGVDQYWGSSTDVGSGASQDFSGRLELESALRIGGIVIENRALYDGSVDTLVCPVDAVCTYGHASGLKRQSSRIVYDMPVSQVRVQAGDTDAIGVPLQRAAEMLGVSIEKSARKLNPTEDITSAGSGSFRLDSASTVDVMVNGAVVQRLQLRPGNYNLRDLPLTSGANAIELVITSENGERRVEKFSSYSDPKLLAPGKSEWAIAAGVPSYLFDNQRTYGAEYLATGYARYGVTGGVTAEADLQGDSDVIMGGAGIDFETAFGIFGLHGAASSGPVGKGTAANIDWSLANFSGLTKDLGESFHFNAEYRSTDFHTPGQFLNGADGIIFSEYNYWLRLNASYTVPVTRDVTATLSGRYQFGDNNRAHHSPFAYSGDRYGADMTLSAALGPAANASLLVGYSNELYGRDAASSIEKDPEFRMALRFNVRPDEATSISSGYDTLGQQSHISAYRGETEGIHHWDTSVDVQSRTYEKSASVNASAGYRGNRGELRLSHFADADGVSFNDFDATTTRQRTSLRAGTGIAFAGSKVAIGAPVRGGAFAIVAPHPTIASSEIMVGNTGNERAIANAWGNALVGDLPAYMPGSMPVDVDNLPLGYSLGSGAFDTFAPYKAGYAIEVGSAYSVSVYGTLVTADGQPVALVTGTAHQDGKPDKRVPVFTNAEGKFGAEGLAPGRWNLDMAADGGTTQFVVDVPDGSTGLVKVGTLTPVGDASKRTTQ